jgi:hypothetical protein
MVRAVVFLSSVCWFAGALDGFDGWTSSDLPLCWGCLAACRCLQCGPPVNAGATEDCCLELLLARWGACRSPHTSSSSRPRHSCFGCVDPPIREEAERASFLIKQACRRARPLSHGSGFNTTFFVVLEGRLWYEPAPATTTESVLCSDLEPHGWHQREMLTKSDECEDTAPAAMRPNWSTTTADNDSELLESVAPAHRDMLKRVLNRVRDQNQRLTRVVCGFNRF